MCGFGLSMEEGSPGALAAGAAPGRQPEELFAQSRIQNPKPKIENLLPVAKIELIESGPREGPFAQAATREASAMRIGVQAKRPSVRKTYQHFSEGHLPKERGYGGSRVSRIQRRMMIGAIGRGGG